MQEPRICIAEHKAVGKIVPTFEQQSIPLQTTLTRGQTLTRRERRREWEVFLMYQLPFLSYFYLSLGYLILLEFLKIKIKTNDKFDRNFLASKLNFNIFANIQKLKVGSWTSKWKCGMLYQRLTTFRRNFFWTDVKVIRKPFAKNITRQLRLLIDCNC